MVRHVGERIVVLVHESGNTLVVDWLTAVIDDEGGGDVGMDNPASEGAQKQVAVVGMGRIPFGVGDGNDVVDVGLVGEVGFEMGL